MVWKNRKKDDKAESEDQELSCKKTRIKWLDGKIAELEEGAEDLEVKLEESKRKSQGTRRIWKKESRN